MAVNGHNILGVLLFSILFSFLLGETLRNGELMNEQDIRVIKTKKAIRDALFAILGTKPLNKITVKEIAEAAEINRKTFYAHYTCIEDIIAELEDEIVSSIDSYLKNCIIEEYGLNPYYFIQFINSIYTSNPEFCENLVSVRNYHFLAEKIKRLFKEQLLLSMNLPKEDLLRMNFQIEFFISGVTSVYIEWLRKDKPCTFEEISDFLLNVIVNSFHAKKE